MKIAVVIACTTGACLSALAAGPAHADSFDAAWDDVTSRFDADLEANSYVGGSLYFLEDGVVVARHHYGSQSLDPVRPVDDDTIWHWASITKMLTAIGVMQLSERGLLSLDDPVVDYVPALADARNPYGSMADVTLRHLLTHSSGLRGPTFPWGGDEAWHPHEPTAWFQFDAMLPYTELEFEPGSRYSYSNPGSSLLGRVIEVVTGDDIEIYVAKNVLMPLGMNQSYFDVTPWHLQPHRSDNFIVRDGEPRANGIDFDTGMTTGNGGLNGPAGDMAKFLAFLGGFGDADRNADVLSRDTLGWMWQPLFLHESFDELDESMARHFFVIDHELGADRTVRYIGHTGGQLGFQTFVYVQPESGTAAIMAVNSRSEGMERVLYNATRLRLFESVFPLFLDTE